jgi:hypothetical protein
VEPKVLLGIVDGGVVSRTLNGLRLRVGVEEGEDRDPYSKSLELETGTMELATEAGVIDPTTNPTAAESASSSKAASSARMAPDIRRVAL